MIDLSFVPPFAYGLCVVCCGAPVPVYPASFLLHVYRDMPRTGSGF